MAFDLEWLEQNALFGCQVLYCAEEVSYHANMLKLYEGRPICEDCFNDTPQEDDENHVFWRDLPEFNPFDFIKALDEVA